MKISFIINEPVQNATGGYKMVYMYANSLVESGHDVCIYYLCRNKRLFTNYKFPFAFKLVIASLLSKKGPRWFNLDKRVQGKAVKEITDSTIGDADIVIATAVNTAIPVFNLNEKKGKKAYFIQDFENWEYEDDYVYKTYALGMTNIVVARWLKEIVDQYSQSKTILISNGIDTNIFYNQHLNRKKHSMVLQYRKTAYKGPEFALKAIKRLQEKYKDLHVSVISTDDAPSDMPSCCEYYKSISPEMVAEINNKSEVFVCTSVEEGYGLPGLEAMACGCAVCSSAYKGVFEYAIDGVNALLSPVRDVNAMVENVSNVFEDENLKHTLINNALTTGNEKSQAAMSKLFLDALRGMLIDLGREWKWCKW
jgi:glycosyltransferase involved in cell wall biosynthesis